MIPTRRRTGPSRAAAGTASGRARAGWHGMPLSRPRTRRGRGVAAATRAATSSRRATWPTRGPARTSPRRRGTPRRSRAWPSGRARRGARRRGRAGPRSPRSSTSRSTARDAGSEGEEGLDAHRSGIAASARPRSSGRGILRFGARLTRRGDGRSHAPSRHCVNCGSTRKRAMTVAQMRWFFGFSCCSRRWRRRSARPRRERVTAPCSAAATRRRSRSCASSIHFAIAAPDGGFENGARGWTLTGGARVVGGKRAVRPLGGLELLSRSGACDLAAHASGSLLPITASFAATGGELLGSLKVEVLYPNVFGGRSSIELLRVRSRAARSGPRPFPCSSSAGLVNALTLNGLTTDVQFRFAPRGVFGGGNWRIDSAPTSTPKEVLRTLALCGLSAAGRPRAKPAPAASARLCCLPLLDGTP